AWSSTRTCSRRRRSRPGQLPPSPGGSAPAAAGIPRYATRSPRALRRPGRARRAEAQAPRRLAGSWHAPHPRRVPLEHRPLAQEVLDVRLELGAELDLVALFGGDAHGAVFELELEGHRSIARMLDEDVLELEEDGLARRAVQQDVDADDRTDGQLLQ